jgi:hypothetical protein
MIDLLKLLLKFGSDLSRWAQLAARTRLEKYFHPLVLIAKVEGSFPPRLKSQTLYVLTEDGIPWQAAMICPCGCGTALDLNLLPDERPRWRFTADDKGRASLDPSVWRKVGCKSHFWLRGGRIIWV